MPIYPKLTAKEAEKLLFEYGFVLDRQKGSHRIYKKKINGWLFHIMLAKYCIQK
jgi:predicted RNA binding protein YcfA (HicA-like mRNA interferase family)